MRRASRSSSSSSALRALADGGGRGRRPQGDGVDVGVGLGHQRQGVLEVPEGLLGPGHPQGGVTGLHAGLAGLLAQPGGGGVAGQLGPGAEAAVVGQRRGIPLVGPDPLARQEVVVDGLAEQRVAEGVAAAVGGDEDVVLDRVAQPGVELGLAEPGHGGQEPVGHVPTRGRGHADDVLAGGVELVEAHEEQPRQVLGQAGAAECGGGDQLLGEERVALGSLDHLAHLRPRAAAGTAGRGPARARRGRAAARGRGARRRRAGPSGPAWCAAGGAGGGRRCGRTRRC